MSAASKYDILAVVEVPVHYRERWKRALGTLAELTQVKAALVMRVHEREIEVFACSDGQGNVYEERECAPLDSGLYCETVMDARTELMVPDALADPAWKDNPDVKLGMISYLGLPLEWPTGNVFGTICVLDSSPHRYSELNRATLQQFRGLVQDELALIFENHLLRQEMAEREEVERELRETQLHLQSLARRLQLGREHERALLARGLHDEIIQNLTAAKMDLDSCLRKLPPEHRDAVRPAVSVVDGRLMDTVAHVRELCDKLIPAVLEDLGLPAAIDWAVADFRRRTGVSCAASIRSQGVALSPEAQRLLFRILEQALGEDEVGRHGGERSVELFEQEGCTVLRVGATAWSPPDAEAASGSWGRLDEMEAQAASWGWTLRTWRTPAGDVFLEVSVPGPGGVERA